MYKNRILAASIAALSAAPYASGQHIVVSQRHEDPQYSVVAVKRAKSAFIMYDLIFNGEGVDMVSRSPKKNSRCHLDTLLADDVPKNHKAVRFHLSAGAGCVTHVKRSEMDKYSEEVHEALNTKGG